MLVIGDSVTTAALQQHQPFLHDLVCALSAPAFALSAPDGQIRRSGVQGYYVCDRRVLSQLIVEVNGVEPAPIHVELLPGGRIRFVAAPRGLGDPGPDPTVLVERLRDVRGDELTETILIRSFASNDVRLALAVAIATDFADLSAVKSGSAQPSENLPTPMSAGLRWTGAPGTSMTVAAQPPPAQVAPAGGRLTWNITVSRGRPAEIVLRVRLADRVSAPVVLADSSARAMTNARVESSDGRLDALWQQSIEDLRGLTLRDPLAPDDVFLAAGAPWFLTLFGRDSIWAARMLLPIGTDLAGGTLRVLARRQGTRVDPNTAEEPGKIPHEMRATAAHYDLAHVAGRAAGAHSISLPPLYYGTVDATPLWISLLHDAWRWGMPLDQVEALLPNLERALAWMSDYASGPTGFLQYADVSGCGLSNQGWKDSGDSIQFANGRLADPPVALCEVQAYAHAAALHGAALLDAFDRPDADRWRGYAASLNKRFREAFWVDDPAGPYPAVALDGRGRRVDTVTSNLGHLLGTGLLTAQESQWVVSRLASPELDSGYGLRTMSSAASGYNPLSYHGGSVWTHDTAIAILGLRSLGTAAADTAAGRLIEGLLAASPHFDYRMPELFVSDSTSRSPMPYPAACRPQAWAAAAVVAIVRALLGADVDIPAGSLRLSPWATRPVGALRFDGLRAGERLLNVQLGPTATISIAGDTGDLVIDTG